MKNKFFTILTALCMTLVLFTGFQINVSAEGTNCTGDHTGWNEISNASDFDSISSGNYCLTADVTLTSQVSIGSGVDVTLCLNGHTITAASGKQIFSISDSLTLCDCSSGKTGKLIGGGSVSFSGGAVDVTGSGTFTMNGGTISGNTAGTGGGVYMRSGASFIMNGGTISNNITNSNGGGVFVASSGIFTMNGGTISDNTTNSNAGGGVFVASSGTFIMNGGMISSNTAAIRGGGVYVNGGTFTMSGGIISGNTTAERGGGVCINGTFEINGKVDISGNKVGNSTDNVNLSTGKTITIGESFDDTSKIGVNTLATPDCKDNFVDVTGTASDISKSFTADISGQSIVYDDGKVQLKGAHTYVGGKCTVCNEPETNTGTTVTDPTETDPTVTDPTGTDPTVTEPTVTDPAGADIELTPESGIADKILTDEEKAKGVTVITEISEDVPDSDKSKVSALLGQNETAGRFLDISLYKNDSGILTPVTEIQNDEIAITVRIPDSIYTPERTYFAVRVHNGEAKRLVSVYDRESRLLTFYTNLFSTYAIAWTEPNAGIGSPVIPSYPTNTGTTVTTVTTAEKITADDSYTGEDISAGAGDNTDDGGIADMSMVVLVIAVAAVVACAVIVKKIVF